MKGRNYIMKFDKQLVKRICMTLFGVIICAISVGFFKVAAFGVDPFQSLMAGLDKMIPIDFGTLYVIVNAVLLLFALFADRHYIGIATFINLFLLGYITDFTHKTLLLNIVDTSSLDPALASEFLAAPTSVNPAGLNIPMWLRIAFIVGAIIVICFGSALYMTADLGVSTYDAVALVITNTWKIGKFQYIRIITDVICVVLGAVIFLLGGGTWGEIPTIIGIGTIITAFFMGPLVEFFNVKIARPLLNK